MSIVLVLGRLLIIGVVLFYVYGFYLYYSVEKEGCNRVLSIASNPQQVSYLDEWAEKHIIDRGFYFASGMHGEVHGSKDGKYFKIMPLPNSDISGIPHEYLRFSVHKSNADFKDEITSDNVKQLDFGYGRDQVILLKNDSELSVYRGADLASKKLVRVNAKTYAYCADSKF